MEDAELGEKNESVVDRVADEDDDDLIELLFEGDEIDTDDFAKIVRPDFVAKAFKALSADAQRGGGSLARSDVNRTYLRRKLSIAECVEIETLLASAGYPIVEEREEALDQATGSADRVRRKYRYLTEFEERELGRRIQLSLQFPKDMAGLDEAYERAFVMRVDRPEAVAQQMQFVLEAETHRIEAGRHGKRTRGAA